jgi:hypothetical protein
MEDKAAQNRQSQNVQNELRRAPGRIANMLNWEIDRAAEFAARLLEEVNDHDGAKMLRERNEPQAGSRAALTQRP